MKFERQLPIQAPLEKVWSFFLDVDRLAACIPGCESVEAINETDFKAVLVDKVGPFRVSFAVDIKIEEMDLNRYVKVSISGRDRKLFSGFRQTVDTSFQELGPKETEVDIVTEVNFQGKLASLGHSQIKRKSDKAMEEFSQNVKARLEES